MFHRSLGTLACVAVTCVVLVGCSVPGNQQGNVSGAEGGFAGNAPLRGPANVAGATGGGWRTGTLTGGSTGTGALATGTSGGARDLLPYTFAMSEHAQIRPGEKTIVLTVSDIPGVRRAQSGSTGTGAASPPAGPMSRPGGTSQNNANHGHPLSVHVPTGWRVQIVLLNNGPDAHTSVIVPFSQRNIDGSYQALTRAEAAPGTSARPASPATPRASAPHTPQTFVFKARTPGNYAVLCVTPGHQNGVLARVSVGAGISPSVATL